MNLFRGESLDRERVRLYGGEVLAQALMAAGRTVDPERHVHSMHAYFLRLGDPKVPVVYDVDRIRDGRSFTTRRVVAIQHGQAIFNLAASFHVPEPGYRALRRDARRPGPRDRAASRPASPTSTSSRSTARGCPHVVDALDFRPVGEAWSPPGESRGHPVRDPDQDTWLRARGRAARRPAPAHVRRRVRVRPHAARHRHAAASRSASTTPGS